MNRSNKKNERRESRRNNKLCVQFDEEEIIKSICIYNPEFATLSISIPGFEYEERNEDDKEIRWYEEEEQEDIPWWEQPDLDEDDEITILCKKLLHAGDYDLNYLRTYTDNSIRDEDLEKKLIHVEASVATCAVQWKNRFLSHKGAIVQRRTSTNGIIMKREEIIANSKWCATLREYPSSSPQSCNSNSSITNDSVDNAAKIRKNNDDDIDVTSVTASCNSSDSEGTPIHDETSNHSIIANTQIGNLIETIQKIHFNDKSDSDNNSDSNSDSDSDSSSSSSSSSSGSEIYDDDDDKSNKITNSNKKEGFGSTEETAKANNRCHQNKNRKSTTTTYTMIDDSKIFRPTIDSVTLNKQFLQQKQRRKSKQLRQNQVLNR